LRKTVLIVVAALVAFAGGALGLRSWSEARTRRAEVERIVQSARMLATSENGLSQAAVELRKALDLDPDHVPALIERGEVCLKLLKIDDSAAHLRRAAELAEGSDLARAQRLLGLALTERYRGTNSDADFRGAHNALLAARQHPAEEAAALEAYGVLFLTKGRNESPERARKAFEQLLARHPDYEGAERIKEIVELLRKSARGG
jgi:tetratricopeptide (TPR) repeat protein